MAAKYIIFATTLFFVGVLADSPVNVTLQEIQGSLDQQEISNLQNKSLSTFKAQCEKNGGPEAFEKAHNASTEFMECIQRLVNVTQLQIEVEAAKPKGEIDEVFKRYCDKKPLFEACIGALTNSTQDCFAVEEQKHLKTVHNVTEQLVDFMCFKEGDRIALFISEGGQECFQNRTVELQQCWNKTVGNDAQSYMEEVSNMHIAFDEKQCKQLTELQHCLVSELEKCTKPTSANILESVFKFIRKSTPCKNFPDNEEISTSTGKSTTITNGADNQKGSASGLAVTSATIIMAVATAIIL